MQLSRTSNASTTDLVYRVVAIILFIWFAIIFTIPVGEGDYFWHVKTGEWIWQHKSLPSFDPFSFTVKDINPFNPQSKRIPFLLKQYWLGQLSFYGIWQQFGEAGMVVFRSLCYTGILLFLYRWGRRLTDSPVWPLGGVVVVGKILQNYSSERPQIFAFVCMPLLLCLLEKLRTDNETRHSLTQGIALPLLMLLWSNCHGSYILGIVIILIYAASHTLAALMGTTRLNRFSLLIMVAACLASGANPNGYGAFKEFFSLTKGYTNLVAEYVSPVTLALQYGAIDWFYWVFLLAAVASLLFSLRKAPLAHILVICLLLALSLSGTRYVPFFVMTAPLICSNLPQWSAQRYLKLLPLLAVPLIMATADYRNVFKFRAERSFPQQAAKFLREAKLSGNMFNYVGWGGYLMCYSDHPVFIDGRTLVAELLPVHDRILFAAGWQELLDLYNINFMVIPGTDVITLKAYPLLLQLLGDDRWTLVYEDEVALVLVRNRDENSRVIKIFGRDKAAITEHIQARWQWQTTNSY